MSNKERAERNRACSELLRRSLYYENKKERKEKKDEKDVFDSSSNVLHDSGIC